MIEKGIGVKKCAYVRKLERRQRMQPLYTRRTITFAAIAEIQDFGVVTIK